MRASYRRHRLWRALTRTRWLMLGFVVLVVVALALDHSHQPKGCYFVQHGLGNGAYSATRVCSAAGKTASGKATRPSADRWEGRELLVYGAMLVAGLLAVLIVIGAVRVWREADVWRARRG